MYRLKNLCFILFFVTMQAYTQTYQSPPHIKNFGIGLAVGDPLGFSAKYWFDSLDALNLALGLFLEDEMTVQGSYHRLLYNFLQYNAKVPFDLWFYTGIGARFSFGPIWERDNFRYGVGPRIPVGALMMFRNAPFDIYLDLGPGVLFGSESMRGFNFDGGIGFHYYF